MKRVSGHGKIWVHCSDYGPGSGQTLHRSCGFPGPASPNRLRKSPSTKQGRFDVSFGGKILAL